MTIRFELQSYSRLTKIFAYDKVCTTEANDGNAICNLFRK
jgi:hypothetical protein